MQENTEMLIHFEIERFMLNTNYDFSLCVLFRIVDQYANVSSILLIFYGKVSSREAEVDIIAFWKCISKLTVFVFYFIVLYLCGWDYIQFVSALL